MSAHRADTCGADLELDMGFYFCPEVGECVFDGCSGSLTQPAVRHLVQVCFDLFQVFKVFHCSHTFSNICKDLVRTLIANAAWIAFATALILEEIDQHLAQVNDACFFVTDQ